MGLELTTLEIKSHILYQLSQLGTPRKQTLKRTNFSAKVEGDRFLVIPFPPTQNQEQSGQKTWDISGHADAAT